MEQIKHTQVDKPLQPWHKPEVMEVEIEETRVGGGSGVDGLSQTSEG